MVKLLEKFSRGERGNERILKIKHFEIVIRTGCTSFRLKMLNDIDPLYNSYGRMNGNN